MANPHQVANLRDKIANASQVKELYQNPAFKDILRYFEEKINDKKHEWLNATTPEIAEGLRQRSKAYEEIFAHLKKQILQGEVAKQVLRRLPESTDPV